MIECKFIRDLSIKELEELITLEFKEPLFRFRQLLEWVYLKDIADFSEMKNMPSSIRTKLAQKFTAISLENVNCLESTKKDAVKFAFKTHDNNLIESVILIDGSRRTLCVSSQIGCALGCIFCETGKLGFIRNLSQSEIIDQIVLANRFLVSKKDKKITNLVFMGMGEALFNFDNFYSAIKIITSETGMGIGGRKITVSTAGVIPSIKKLQESDLNVKLAISLNSYNDEMRNMVMPVNKKFPIKELVKAAKEFSLVKGSAITFEYVLIKDQSDTDIAAKSLINLLGNMNCKINLIPVNPCSTAGILPPEEKNINLFGNILATNGLTVTVRKSRGQDISGACGQLAGKINRDN